MVSEFLGRVVMLCRMPPTSPFACNGFVMVFCLISLHFSAFQVFIGTIAGGLWNLL